MFSKSDPEIINVVNDGHGVSINNKLFPILASELTGSELKVFMAILPFMANGKYYEIKNSIIATNIDISHSVVIKSIKSLKLKGYIIRHQEPLNLYRLNKALLADKVSEWCFINNGVLEPK